MKSKEVLQLLGVSRVTLSKYVKNGTIKVTELDNGTYDYDQKSIFKLLKKDNRKNILYARVSTSLSITFFNISYTFNIKKVDISTFKMI